MAFLSLVELLLFLFLGYVFLTQLVVPLFKGTRLFPFLRRKRMVTYNELLETLDEKDRTVVEFAVAESKRLLAEQKKLIEEQKNVSTTGK